MGEITECPDSIAQKRGIPDQQWQVFPAMAGSSGCLPPVDMHGMVGPGVRAGCNHRTRLQGASFLEGSRLFGWFWNFLFLAVDALVRFFS